jgi:tetratricopeptide (TPR) repeat protein
MATTPEAQDYFNRGLDKLHSGQWQEALDEFSEAIKLRPDIAVGWRYRSYAFADAGNFLRAIADLDEAIRLNPDDVQSYYDRGQHLLRQRQYELALADCNKAIELEPARADVIALRGRVHAARGASEHAMADFGKAIELDPEGAKDYHTWRGDLYAEMEFYNEAIDDYNASLRSEPNQPAVLAQRAHCHWMLEDHDSALLDLNQAIELDPAYPWLRVRRGALHQDRKELDEALIDFGQAIEKNPKYVLAYEYRAEVRYKMGQRAEAMADLAEALKLQPDARQTLRILNRRAMWYYFNKEYTRAIKDHMDALKKEPNDAPTFNYLAWIWCTAPDPNVRNGRRALECATRANELTEFENPAFLDTLAAAHAELGNFSEALSWEGKALELAEDERAEDEYTKRMEQYENRQPLRVTPREGV